MNVFEQVALGEFVDTLAERPAWVQVLTNINETLSLVLDCVASYCKRAVAEGRTPMQPYAFFATHVQVSGLGVITSSTGHKHWKMRLEQQQPQSTGELSEAELLSYIQRVRVALPEDVPEGRSPDQ